MLINGTMDSRRSVIIGLVLSMAFVASIGLAVYKIQHPYMTQQERIQASLNQ